MSAQLTAPPTAPSRSQQPATFITNADAFIAWFSTFVSQMNPVITDINTVSPLLTPAINAASSSNTLSSSTTSLTIPASVPSSQSLTLANTGKSFSVGHPVILVSLGNPYNYMVGTVTAFTAGTGAMTVNVLYTYGTGTYSDWVVALTPMPQTTTNNSVVSKSSTYNMTKADLGKVIIASGTWSLTYDATATLGNGWYHWIKTSSTSSIIVDPNGTEQVNGSTTVTLVGGGLYLIYSDGTGLTSIQVSGPGNSEVVVHTGNGHGSTNTVIRRFTTTLTSVGTAITYADSATLGGSFTINETGLYSIHYSDIYNGGIPFFGVSVNSSQLTTAINSITIANRLTITSSYTSLVAAVSRVVRLSAGDIVRAHTDGTVNGGANTTFFAIRKIGNE